MNTQEIIDRISNMSKDILKEKYNFTSLSISLLKHDHIDLTTKKISATVFFKELNESVSYEAESLEELFTIFEIKLRAKLNNKIEITF